MGLIILAMTDLFNLGYPATEYKSTRPAYRGTSLQDFHARFPDDESCLLHVFRTRFGDRPQCPQCGKPGSWYRIRRTKRFQHPCGQAISPFTGTVFERSSIHLQLWFYAMLHFANSSHGVPTTFLARHLGICHKTAFRLADRIRMQMAAIDKHTRIGMPGEPFEVRIEHLDGVKTRHYPARGAARAVLLGDSLGVQATLVGKPRRHVLRTIIAEKATVDAIAVTTCKYTYSVSSEFGARPPAVQLVREFVDPATGTNPIKSFLNYLRRPMHNTYRRVDYANLWKYLKEFEFAFNRRLRSHEIFPDMIGRFPDFGAASLAALERWSSRDCRYYDKRK